MNKTSNNTYMDMYLTTCTYYMYRYNLKPEGGTEENKIGCCVLLCPVHTDTDIQCNMFVRCSISYD